MKKNKQQTTNNNQQTTINTIVLCMKKAFRFKGIPRKKHKHE